MGKTGPEAKLVKAMRDEGHRIYGDRLVVIKYHGSAYSEAGVSDLLLCLDGVFVAVEVKAPDNYGSVEAACRRGPTAKQRVFLDRVLTAGGCAGVAASVEQFMHILIHADKRVSDSNGVQAWPCAGHNLNTD